MSDISFEDFGRLAKSVEELGAHVIALTAVIAAIATTATVDFERIEDCVNFAARQLRPGRRPLVFAKAAVVLEDLEGMQKVLRIETRKIRRIRKAASRRR